MKYKSFHYHLTVGNCTARQLRQLAKRVKAKPTRIDLYSAEKNQTDRMITKYSNNFDVLKEQAKKDIDKLKKLGFDIVRLKIEADTPENRIILDQEGIYSEIHAKVKEEPKPMTSYQLLFGGGTGLPKTGKLSKNTVDGAKFVNFRIKNRNQLHEAIEFLKSEQRKGNLISLQNEVVLLDTNPSHDFWWAKQR